MPPISRQNNFNLLRLILALLVLVSHGPEIIDGNRSRELLTSIFRTLSFGELAVDGFFILSGFLIVQSWKSSQGAADFLKKRVRRIYPGFVVASIVSVYLIGPFATADAKAYFAALSHADFALRTALLQAPETPAIFAGLPYPSVNGSMWTISVEFACYLLVLALGMLGAVRKRFGWLALACAVTAVFAVERFGVAMSGLPAFAPRLASCFMIGGVFCLYRERIVYSNRAALLAAIALAVLMFSWRASELAVALFGTYLLFFLAFKRSTVLENFNNLPDVSYGVYLYGWPIQILIVWYFPDIDPWLLVPLSCVAALAAGALSWYGVERLFMHSKLRLKQPQVA